MKTLTKYLLAGTTLLSGGCHLESVDRPYHLRGGLEAQYYDIKEIKTDFETPNVSDRFNLGIYCGADRKVYQSENQRLSLGLDLRFNTDTFSGDNRSKSSGDYGDCVEWGDVSFVRQGVLTPIPFIGYEAKINKNLKLNLEIGMPYTRWHVETGRTSVTCFDDVLDEEEDTWGKRIRFGLSGTGNHLAIEGVFLNYETYSTSHLDVDVLSIQVTAGF